MTSIALFHACPRKYLLSSIMNGHPPARRWHQGKHGAIVKVKMIW